MSENKKIFATPKVRKFARELGANISEIEGSERLGRISEEDVKNFVNKNLNKSQTKEDIKIFLSDPYGSALYNYYKKDELKAEGNSITEGIGQGRITENLKHLVVDDAVRINDKEALEMIFKLLKEEGLFLGGSSGINVCGAIKMAEKLGPGHNIVTILCDSGQRYQSKIWNKSFLKSKDLPFPSWME